MSAIPRRAKAVLERFGDPFTVGGSSRKGVFAVADREAALGFLSQAEFDAAVKPVRVCHVPHDDATAVGDTVVWDGLSLAVKRVISLRFRGEVVARMLVLG